MGSEDEVEQSLGGLAVRRAAGPSGHANSPHPSSREGHHSTARWSSSFLLSGLILPVHAATASPGPPELGAVNPDAVQDHGQPACQRHNGLFHPAPLGDLHRPRLPGIVCVAAFSFILDALVLDPQQAIAQAAPASQGTGPRFRADGPNADEFGRKDGYPSCKGLAYIDQTRCRVGAAVDTTRCFLRAPSDRRAR